jgi:hypothetical protein
MTLPRKTSFLLKTPRITISSHVVYAERIYVVSTIKRVKATNTAANGLKTAFAFFLLCLPLISARTL